MRILSNTEIRLNVEEHSHLEKVEIFMLHETNICSIYDRIKWTMLLEPFLVGFKCHIIYQTTYQFYLFNP